MIDSCAPMVQQTDDAMLISDRNKTQKILNISLQTEGQMRDPRSERYQCISPSSKLVIEATVLQYRSDL